MAQVTDYRNDIRPNWCPGCGHYGVQAAITDAVAQLDISPDNLAVISGIGCSSRLPYYMNTYAMQTIHGRAAAISTGAKVANPNLTVWQISGDGDGLAIGGNHFIHAVRRNIDLNMILLNNRIYGLTKGQYSPTSERGFVSKSSPYGTVEDPFHPAELLLRCTRPLLCTSRCHGCSRNGGNPESRLQPQRSQRLRDSPELRHLQ